MKKLLILIIISIAISSQARAQCKSGQLVKLAEPDKTIWIISDGLRYAIVNWTTFHDICHYDFSKVNKAVDPSILNSSPIGGVVAADGTFVRYTGTDTIYYIQGGKRRPIVGWNTYLQLGGPASLFGDNISIQDASFMKYLPEGDPIAQAPPRHGGGGSSSWVCWANAAWPGGVECHRA